MADAECGIKTKAIVAFFSFRIPNLLSLLYPHVLPPPSPLLLHDWVDDVRNEGIDARQVANDVQVDVARLKRLAVAPAEPVDVGLDELALHGAEFLLVPEHAVREVPVVGREGGNGCI